MFKFFDCITRINQILNYPSFSYSDVSHFFDQAISELNTSFRIRIPLVSQMIDENRIDVYNIPNIIILTSPPGNISSVPNATGFVDIYSVYYNTSDGKLYRYSNATQTWDGFDEIYGIYANPATGISTIYRTMFLAGVGSASWYVVDPTSLEDFNLNIYLPTDWIILFLIPYVCFKAAVRDGAEGSLYNEEFVQGMQQLQTSYDIPNFVRLKDVAHLPAYTQIVKDNLDKLDVVMPTRAIYDFMKIGNAIMPAYGGMYDTGGWGI